MHNTDTINVNIISRFSICVHVCTHTHMIMGDSGSQKVSDPLELQSQAVLK